MSKPETVTYHKGLSPEVVSVTDLQPGDVVTPAWSSERSHAFDASIVEGADDKSVTVFRPYMTCSQYVYGLDRQEAIPYIGHERITYSRTGTYRFTLWSRLVTVPND